MSPRIERNSPQFRTQSMSDIPGNPVDFMKTAVPSDVSKATALKHPTKDGNFDDSAIAFRMRDPKSGKSVDMVWDRKADALYMLDRGEMVPATTAVKAATIDRLLSDERGASLKATRKGSLYDDMQRDMLEHKSSSNPTDSRKEPPLPPQKDAAPFDAEAFYASLNDAADGARTNQLDIEQRPIGAVPTADYLAAEKAGDAMLKELGGHVSSLNTQIDAISKRIALLEKKPTLADADRSELERLQAQRGVAQAMRAVLKDREAQIRAGVKALAGGYLTAEESKALTAQDWRNDWNTQQVTREARALAEERPDRTRILA